MAWGGARRATAATITAAVLGVLGGVAVGCSGSPDDAQALRTDLARLAAVADADVTASGAGARIVVRLAPGLDDAGVLELAATVDRLTTGRAGPAYRLDLRESDTADTLVVDEAFPGDPRAAEVVAAWRRATAGLAGDTTLTYDGRRTTVLIASAGAMAADVAEAARLAPPPGPVTWRFASGPGTAVLDGPVRPTDVALVERAVRGLVSPSLPLAAARWRLDRRRSQVQLDLLTDPGVPAADLLPTTWGQRLAPLARAGFETLGRPRREVTLRLVRAGGSGTDVFAWWTSEHAPAEGRDRLGRGWDAWLASQRSASRPAGRRTSSRGTPRSPRSRPPGRSRWPSRRRTAPPGSRSARC